MLLYFYSRIVFLKNIFEKYIKEELMTAKEEAYLNIMERIEKPENKKLKDNIERHPAQNEKLFNDLDEMRRLINKEKISILETNEKIFFSQIERRLTKYLNDNGWQ